MDGSARIIRGNALALPLADGSVDLVVTSPPYFGVRSYQDGGEHYAGQIGSEATPVLLAKVLGRHGIHVDMSADYCRLAAWRTTDPGEIARAMQVEKPVKQVNGQVSMFDLLDEEGTA